MKNLLANTCTNMYDDFGILIPEIEVVSQKGLESR